VDYQAASASVTLIVNQATPVITWPSPASVVQGATLSSTQLDATANVPGSFSYSPAAGTVLNTAGTNTLSTTFSPTDTTDYTTAGATVSLLVIPTAGTAVVDFGTTEQTIRGFGGSTAWMSALSSAAANALFGTGSGQVGLSILRVRIDPTSTTGGSNWLAELTSAQEAQAVNSSVSVIATPWTPPAVWKSNSSTVMGSLNTAHYADYAAYLNSFTAYMAAGNVNLYAISMQNEPDASVSYESCVWNAAQMDTWVANNASVLTTKLMMPESESFITSLSDTALNDSSAVGNIGIIAGHIYGVSPSYYTNAKSKGKEVWMTEHYLSPSGTQPAIADALAAAKEIHDSLTVGQYNAYVWWWALDWNPGTGVVTNSGLVDTTNKPNYYGYAMAQFARFVRPGYVRANATATPVTGVYLSAYSGSGHTVIVAINTNASATSLPVFIENQAVTSLTPYQTTASAGVTALSPVSVSGGNFTAALPAQSITTFVQ
jgi:glucuronoarabinoxylan endo-1,4-beta-xylanase